MAPSAFSAPRRHACMNNSIPLLPPSFPFRVFVPSRFEFSLFGAGSGESPLVVLMLLPPELDRRRRPPACSCGFAPSPKAGAAVVLPRAFSTPARSTDALPSRLRPFSIKSQRGVCSCCAFHCSSAGFSGFRRFSARLLRPRFPASSMAQTRIATQPRRPCHSPCLPTYICCVRRPCALLRSCFPAAWAGLIPGAPPHGRRVRVSARPLPAQMSAPSAVWGLRQCRARGPRGRRGARSRRAGGPSWGGRRQNGRALRGPRWPVGADSGIYLVRIFFR